jgi:hypothetical protein
VELDVELAFAAGFASPAFAARERGVASVPGSTVAFALEGCESAAPLLLFELFVAVWSLVAAPRD